MIDLITDLRSAERDLEEAGWRAQAALRLVASARQHVDEALDPATADPILAAVDTFEDGLRVASTRVEPARRAVSRTIRQARELAGLEAEAAVPETQETPGGSTRRSTAVLATGVVFFLACTAASAFVPQPAAWALLFGGFLTSMVTLQISRRMWDAAQPRPLVVRAKS